MSFVRGQVTGEFSFVLLALMALFFVFILIYNSQTINFTASKNRMEASKIAQTLSAAINYVYLSGDGTSYNLTLIGDRSANISLSGNAVWVFINNDLATASLLTDRYNTSQVLLGELVITNNGGIIGIRKL